MRFAPPGRDCVYCSCRDTVQVKPKKLEHMVHPFPFVIYRCPHCFGRFWRLSLRKLSGIVLIIAAGVCLFIFRDRLPW
jgi:hypothetical protein